jgi:hypothetical protein
MVHSDKLVFSLLQNVADCRHKFLLIYSSNFVLRSNLSIIFVELIISSFRRP